MERTYALNEIDVVASELLETYGKSQKDHAVLIALQGGLGAGKTTLVQAIARHLGVSESVTSPTFILEKVYELKEGVGFKRLVHIDAYRFEDPQESSVLRFGELLDDPCNLIILEWPERMGDLLPHHAHFFEIGIVDETTRSITYAGQKQNS